MMNSQEQARELAAKERQQEEHIKESMLNRTQAEVHNPSGTDNFTQEQARELAAKERQHEEHIKESMLNRAKSQSNTASDTSQTSAS
jgi:hypothetical protein